MWYLLLSILIAIVALANASAFQARDLAVKSSFVQTRTTYVTAATRTISITVTRVPQVVTGPVVTSQVTPVVTHTAIVAPIIATGPPPPEVSILFNHARMPGEFELCGPLSGDKHLNRSMSMAVFEKCHYPNLHEVLYDDGRARVLDCLSRELGKSCQQRFLAEIHAECETNRNTSLVHKGFWKCAAYGCRRYDNYKTLPAHCFEMSLALNGGVDAFGGTQCVTTARLLHELRWGSGDNRTWTMPCRYACPMYCGNNGDCEM